MHERLWQLLAMDPTHLATATTYASHIVTCTYPHYTQSTNQCKADSNCSFFSPAFSCCAHLGHSGSRRPVYPFLPQPTHFLCGFERVHFLPDPHSEFRQHSPHDGIFLHLHTEHVRESADADVSDSVSCALALFAARLVHAPNSAAPEAWARAELAACCNHEVRTHSCSVQTA